jgi:hypothetical protein
LIITLAFLLTPALVRGAEEPPAHRLNGDLVIRARAILLHYCAECHTGAAEPGQSKLKLLDYKQLTSKGHPVAFISPDGRSQVLELIRDGSMPPANRPGPKADEIAVLEKWVRAGAPAYPQAFDDRFALETVADDFQRQNEKIKDGSAGQSLRYASFVHLVRDGQPLPDLAAAERQLNDALVLAAGVPVKIAPIDPTAALFRIELDGLGWRTRELFERVERRKSTGAHPLRPFDLLLLDYPFGEVRPPGEAALTSRLEKLLDAKAQVRPVPFVRGDWLATALVRGGKLTPLADDIKSLAALDKALARMDPPPDGPAVPRALGTEKPVVTPHLTDGRAALPPLSGWYTGDVTPDPEPFELTAELVADGKPVNGVAVDEPFKLRVWSTQRVYLVLLMVQADGEVRVQEVVGGGVLQPKLARELAPGASGFTISGIITGGNSATEYFVLFASESELPVPTLVRSTHADRPVWRFTLEPTAKEAFDPNKVVRRVIPIRVTKK